MHIDLTKLIIVRMSSLKELTASSLVHKRKKIDNLELRCRTIYINSN